MKIDKAIEIQEQYLRQPETHLSDDLDDAVKLGIEALKEIRRQRPVFLTNVSLLPGETK